MSSVVPPRPAPLLCWPPNRPPAALSLHPFHHSTAQLIKAIQIIYPPHEAEALISTSATLETGRGYKNKLKRALAKELERRLRDGSLNLKLCLGGSDRRHVGALGSAHASGESGLAGVGSAASKSAAFAHAFQQISQQQVVAGLPLAPPPAAAVMPGMPGLAHQQLASHWSELPWAQSLARGALASGTGASSWARIQRMQAEESHHAMQLQHRLEHGALQRQYELFTQQQRVGATAGANSAPFAPSAPSAAGAVLEAPVEGGVPSLAAESLAAAAAASTKEAGAGNSLAEGGSLDALNALHMQQVMELVSVQTLETILTYRYVSCESFSPFDLLPLTSSPAA